MKKALIWSSLMVFILTLSCKSDKDETLTLSAPQITVAPDTKVYLPGETATITVDVAAPGGLKDVTIGSTTFTEFDNPQSVTGLSAQYVIPTDADHGEHLVTITATDLQSPSRSTTAQAVLNVNSGDPCEDYDESAVISGPGKIAITDFTANNSGLISAILINNTNDEGGAGVENPQGCGLVMMFDKTPGDWDGWNGFRIVLDEPFSSETFRSFGRSEATHVMKIDVLRKDKSGSGDFPAEGLPIYVNVGNTDKYGDHPVGRSQYLIGTITKNNEWETITLTHNAANSGDIDTNVADDESDMFEFIPAGGIAADGGLYYFNNLRLEETAANSGLAQTICDYHIDEEALLNSGWTKIFDEDFSSNLSQWDVWTGGAYNNELQFYQSDNLSLADGKLVIQVNRETVIGPENPHSGSNKTFEFTSGRIESNMTFSANSTNPKVRMVARIKLPNGLGLWPAFWSYGDPWPTEGEIDILEARGENPTKYQTNYFYGTTAGNNLVQYATGYIEAESDLTACFHVYEVVWEQNKLTFYLDGNIVHETTGGYVDQLFGKTQNIALNVAVGGDFFGNLDPATIEEGTMYVDYVRVYTSN